MTDQRPWLSQYPAGIPANIDLTRFTTLKELLADSTKQFGPKPAFTCTPTSKPSDPEDHHDRIDFIFVRGDSLVVEEAHVVGEKNPEADIVVVPWPSDHRAIVATVRFPQ